jgi:hypothetical protein
VVMTTHPCLSNFRAMMGTTASGIVRGMRVKV